MTDVRDSIRVRHPLFASPSEIWAAVRDSERLGRWLAPTSGLRAEGVVCEPRVGGRLAWTLEQEGRPVVHFEGRITGWEPEVRLEVELRKARGGADATPGGAAAESGAGPDGARSDGARSSGTRPPEGQQHERQPLHRQPQGTEPAATDPGGGPSSGAPRDLPPDERTTRDTLAAAAALAPVEHLELTLEPYEEGAEGATLATLVHTGLAPEEAGQLEAAWAACLGRLPLALEAATDRFFAAFASGPAAEAGFWTDEPDATERVAARCRAGELDDEDAARFLHWIERGWTVFEGAVDPEHARALNAHVDGLFVHGDPAQWIERFEGATPTLQPLAAPVDGQGAGQGAGQGLGEAHGGPAA